MSNKKLIDMFIAEKRVEGRSEATILNYTKQMKYFQVFLEGRAVVELNREDVKDYRLFLINSGRKASSVNTAMRIVKSFYNFLLHERYIDLNPFHGIASVDEGKREVVVLQEGEPVDLISVIDNVRDRAMVKLLLATGLRAIEVRNLKVSQLELDLTVIGKGNKERTIPLQCQVLDEVLEYVNSRDIRSEYVFCNQKGGILGESTIRTIIKKYVRKAGLPEKISTHKLRATYATTLYDRDVDVMMMKELLGHESLETTNRYTKINREKKREAIDGINFF